MSKALIDILIPVYNNHDYLEELVESILDYNDVFRIVIADDNPSNPYNGRFLKSVKVSYSLNKRNLGRCGNYMFLLSCVKSDYFLFMDGDDMLHRGVDWLSIINSNDAEIYITNYSVMEDGELRNVLKFDNRLYRSRDFLNNWHDWRFNPGNGACIYRSSLLSRLNYDCLRRDILNWDILFQRKMFFLSNNLRTFDSVTYVWRHTGSNGSISSSFGVDLMNFGYLFWICQDYILNLGFLKGIFWMMRSFSVYLWFLIRKHLLQLK